MNKNEKFTLRVDGNQEKFRGVVASLLNLGYSCAGWEMLDGSWDPHNLNFIYFTKTGDKTFKVTWGAFGFSAETKTTFKTKDEILNYLNSGEKTIGADTVLYLECEDLAEITAAKAYIESTTHSSRRMQIRDINWNVITFNYSRGSVSFYQIIGRESSLHGDLKKIGIKYNFPQLREFVQDSQKILELKQKKEIKLENGAKVSLNGDIIKIGCKEYAVKSIALLVDLLNVVEFEKLESNELTFGPDDAKKIKELIERNG